MFTSQQQVKWHDELLYKLGAVAEYVSYADYDLIEEAGKISPKFAEFITANFKSPAELKQLVSNTYRQRILSDYLGDSFGADLSRPPSSEDISGGFVAMDDIFISETPEMVSIVDLYTWERTIDEWLNTRDEAKIEQRGDTTLEMDISIKQHGVHRIGPFHRLVRAPTKSRSKTAKWKKKTYSQKWHWFPMVATYYRPNMAGPGPSYFIKRAPAISGTPMAMSNPPPRVG